MTEPFPIKLRLTRIDQHIPHVWSFFMAPQHGERPNFTAGQVAVLEMEEFGQTYLAFASAPEDQAYEFLVKRGKEASVASALFDSRLEKSVTLTNIVGRGFPVESYQEHDLVF